ncbi:MAG: hypothetical protein ACKPKO_42900, partial [Candidatus Fonsibacter sp.]
MKKVCDGHKLNKGHTKKAFNVQLLNNDQSLRGRCYKDTEHARRLWVAESQRLEALLQASEAKRRLVNIDARNASASSSTTVEANRPPAVPEVPQVMEAPQELE